MPFKINILILILVTSGCAFGPIAQNPNEFIGSFKDIKGEGTWMSKKTETIKLSLNSASKKLKKKLVPCLNGSVTLKSGFSIIAHDVWTTKLHKINKKKQRITVQIAKPNSMAIGEKGPPKDGYYMAVVDLDYIKKNKTKVSYYFGNSAEIDVVTPAQNIFKGKKSRCKFD